MVTAASPITTYAAEMQMVESVNLDGEDSITRIETEVGKDEASRFLFIKLNQGGIVVLNKDEENQQTVKLEEIDKKLCINVYDREGTLLSSEDAEENQYTYLYETEADKVVTVNALPAKGFGVADFESVKSDVKEDTGFTDSIADGEEAAESFAYPVLMDDDTVITVRFKEELKEEATDEEVKDAEDGKTEGTEEVTDAEDKADAAEDKNDAENTEDKAEGTEESADATEPTEGEDATETPEGEEDLLIGQPEESDGEDAEVTEGEDDLLIGQPEDTEAPEGEDDLLIEKPENTEDEDDLLIEKPEDAEASEKTEGEDDLLIEQPEDGETVEGEDGETAEDEEATEETPEDAETADGETNAEETEDNFIIEDSETTEENMPEEHFLETRLEDLDRFTFLNDEDFAAARLVVMTDNPEIIIDPENQIACYGNIYLMQYKTVSQAKNAYLYYIDNAEAAEPDMPMTAASVDAGEEIVIQDVTNDPAVPEVDPELDTYIEGVSPADIAETVYTEEDNPISALAEEEASVPAQIMSKVIALIDTGASEGPNVIDRVSLIDDILVGGTHGDDMVKYITEEDPDARILSIRALGNDGYGSYSAVAAAVEYAINSHVDIINLSMYSKKSLTTGVLEAQIQKAVDSGITVIGSAGNDGVDVAEGYVPACIEDVYTIGTVNENGRLSPISNFGELVDYYVVSTSTSEAAARFSGYVSAHGIEAVPEDSTGIIFAEPVEVDDSYENDDIFVDENNPDTEKTNDTIYDPVIENYVKEHADTAYVGEGKLRLVNVMDVDATIAAEEQLNPGETIDTLNAYESGFRFMTQQTGRVPVYQFGDNSEYVVAFADVMHNESRARFVDYQIGENNVAGRQIEGSYFDKESGLVYIPKKAFYGPDGEYYYLSVQTQILYAISDFNIEHQWNSAAYMVTEEADGEVTSGMEGDNIMMQAMTVQVGKYMDVEKMFVTVNGFPIDGDLYAYNPDTGLMTIGFSSAVVQSVWVQAEKSPDAPEVEPGMKAAGWDANHGANSSSTAVSFADMKAVSETQLSVDADKFDSLKVGYGGKRTVALAYPGSGMTVWNNSINLNRDTVVHAYRGLAGYADSAVVKWIVYGDGTIGKVYNGCGYPEYNLAVKLRTLDDDLINFQMLPDSLFLAMECTHTNVGSYGSSSADILTTAQTYFRCVAVNKTGDRPWAVFGAYTDIRYGQHGVGFFKVYLKPTTGLKISKKLNFTAFSLASDRIRLKTKFQIYKKYDKSKPLGQQCSDPYGSAITIEENTGNYRATVEINNIPPGIYYLQETGRCDGCVINQNVYRFTITSGKTTSTFDNMTTGKTDFKYIGNVPTQRKIKIVKKAKGENGEKDIPLKGAMFRVKYYPDKRTSTTQKAPMTWYLETDENGEALYDPEHLVESWTDSKGRQRVSSPLLYTDSGYYCLPVCYLYIQEMKAPDGYLLDEKEYELQVTAVKDEDGLYTIARPDPKVITIYDPMVKDDDWYVRVNIKKVDKELKGLAGAKFGVYWDADCTLPIEDAFTNPDDRDNSHTHILTSTDPDGMTETLIIPIPKDPEGNPIEEITIYCKEESAPDDTYAKTNEVFALTFLKKTFDDKKAEFEVQGKEFNKLLDCEEQTFKTKDGTDIVNEKGWNVYVDAMKIDDAPTPNPLEGAVFDVYKDATFTEENKVGTITSGPDGRTEILEVGVSVEEETIKLYCVERIPPDGYSKTDKFYTVEFTKKEYDDAVAAGETQKPLKTFGIDSPVLEGEEPGKGIVNYKGWEIQMDAKKIDGDGKPLAGAVFGIFTDEACTEQIGTMTSGDTGMTDIFQYAVSNDNEDITLYCKEIAPPTGYVMVDGTESYTFTRDKYNELKAAASNPDEFKGELHHFFESGLVNPTPTPPEVTPPPPPGDGEAHVKKTSAAAEDIIDLETYSLAGAVFRVTAQVYWYNDDTTLDHIEDFQQDITTGEDGISNTIDIRDNSFMEQPPSYRDPATGETITPDPIPHSVTTTYHVEEIKAPDGHRLNNGSWSFSVTFYPPETGIPPKFVPSSEIQVKDEPLFSDMELIKRDAKGNPIEDVVFKAEYFDNMDGSGSPVRTWYLQTDAAGRVKVDEAHIATLAKWLGSDPLFTHGGKTVLPIGYLRLTEVDAPAEFVMSDKPVEGPLEAEKMWEPTGIPIDRLDEVNGKDFINDIERCSIKIHKYEEDGTTPLDGVEFKLTFLEEAFKTTPGKQPWYEPLLPTKEGKDYIVRSTVNGEVTFENLDQGKYRLEEIKSAPGHTLLKDPIDIIITLPMTMTEEEANNYGNVDFSTGKKDESYTGKWYFCDISYDVTNGVQFVMPVTGADGIWKYAVMGMTTAAVIATGIIIMETNKKKRRRRKRHKPTDDKI